MRQIANFFTIYWCIYFPTCIAYNETVSWFSSIDEIMTGILIAYTIFQKGKRSIDRKPWKEYIQFWGILSFFTVYSLMFGRNVTNGVLLDFIQELRPFSVIYCTWILNPRFSRTQKNWMLGVMVITLFSWIYYHPVSAFEAANGIQAEFPILGQLAICTGMSWYLFTDNDQKNKYIALALVLTGLIAPKFKFMGEVVCFVYIMFVLKRRLNFKSPKTVWTIVLLMVSVLFVTWERFDAYYVSGWSGEGESGRMARPETYKTAIQILWDYFPFGSGMGSFACNGAWKYYSPLYHEYNLDNVWGLGQGGGFICDAYYPTLAQFGVVGLFFFVLFWKRRLLNFNEIKDLKYYRVAFITFFCLAIEQAADSSWLSGKGMGYCMLLGLCLNANRNIQNSMKYKDEDDSAEKTEREEIGNAKHLRDDYWDYHKRHVGAL